MNPGALRISLAWLGICVVAAGAAGCKPVDEALAKAAVATQDQVSVMTDGVNYMHERSVEYTLYDPAQQPPRAIGGSIVDRLAQGGNKGCCINLAKTWKPGMKVRLTWAESDRDHTYEKLTRDFEIPRYEKPADLYVVFYPGPEHDVELVVSSAEPGHPDWRGRNKKTPWDQCVETYGRKPCKAALPKQFDTGARGYCWRATEEKNKDAAENCWFLRRQCVADYEDEEFCKSLLWDPTKK